MAPGGFSALLLLAVTVQLSLAMLEWAGPASADTRQRLATTIVAAAHRGVFTEQVRTERPRGLRAASESVIPTAAPELAQSVWTPGPGQLMPGWRTALPPPAC